MNWMDRIKSVKKLATKIKRKADTKIEKEKVKRAQQKADEIKAIDSRLKELKREEQTQAKRDKIAKLEKKLTTSGKAMTLIESGLKQIQKQMKKGTRRTPRKKHTSKSSGKR